MAAAPAVGEGADIPRRTRIRRRFSALVVKAASAAA
jgi:hypothetical protein